MEKLKVVGICGSLRKNSINKDLLLYLSKLLPENYMFELGDLSEVPLYNTDLEEDLPIAVKNLAEKIKNADVVIISSPEYNSSITGVLKNALDWISRPVTGTPLSNKLAAIIGATPGMLGTVRGQLHLREILYAMNAQLIRRPEVLISQAPSKINDMGEIIDEKTVSIMDNLVLAIIEEVEKKRESTAIRL
ncbi:NADPH-dependent FMN reductase [Bacillus sp. CGMCC 1.16607]|uniref:NADPH-dependent FMN reductase n=1 Tax=Bacillus sp. CGMCC 1.16607 TaxID=3351842 RepID=UPI00363D73ED